MADYLKNLSVQQTADWYYRLADQFAKIKVEGHTPLASVFLKHWLDNRIKDSTFFFKAPPYLQSAKCISEVLKYHRAVFFTEKKARLQNREIWGGVKPRLKGENGHLKWSMAQPLIMNYESLCDIAPGLIDIIAIQTRGTSAERDIFTSLRGFQLRSDVVVTGKEKNAQQVEVKFQNWKCTIIDTYDWKYDEYLTVPNPDYKSTQPNAVRPQDESLRVYHSNAKRLEDAKLAAPYKIMSKPWGVTHLDILSASIINRN